MVGFKGFASASRLSLGNEKVENQNQSMTKAKLYLSFILIYGIRLSVQHKKKPLMNNIVKNGVVSHQYHVIILIR